MCSSNDHEIYETKNPDVVEAAKKCAGISCTGSCTSDCMIREVGFSAQCSTCFGDGATCGLKNCWTSCMWGSGTRACKRCLENHCKEPLLRCTGFNPNIELEYRMIF